jgi:hypothetical protein
MKLWIFLLLSFFSFSGLATNDFLEERLYSDYQKLILEKETKQNKLQGFTSFEQSLFVDALWDLAEEGSKEAIQSLSEISTLHYDLVEKLRVEILRLKYGRSSSLSSELQEELKNVLLGPEVEKKLIYTIAAYEKEILRAGHQELIDQARVHPEYFDILEDEVRQKEITTDVVADLFYESPDVTTYMNGEYVRSVKIFMFCRTNRLYPCLMTMRDAFGEVVRNTDGTLWTHPALASSKFGLPSYSRNGNTPAGVMTIDSVMPVADQQISYGKFRRMILNFIPRSKNEVLLKSLLPKSSQDELWWKPTITARDMGRNLFRIHGSGKLNTDPATPYYPFVRTSGCVAQRENTYDGVTYRDQRELLDAIMKALDLVPNYENELKVKGILYLIEIDDQDAPVLAHDLKLRGIE